MSALRRGERARKHSLRYRFAHPASSNACKCDDSMGVPWNSNSRAVYRNKLYTEIKAAHGIRKKLDCKLFPELVVAALSILYAGWRHGHDGGVERYKAVARKPALPVQQDFRSTQSPSTLSAEALHMNQLFLQLPVKQTDTATLPPKLTHQWSFPRPVRAATSALSFAAVIVV